MQDKTNSNDEFLAQFANIVIAAAYVITEDMDSAERAAQATFCEWAKERPAIDGETEKKAWLIARVRRNAVLDTQEALPTVTPAPIAEPSVVAPAPAATEVSAATDAFAEGNEVKKPSAFGNFNEAYESDLFDDFDESDETDLFELFDVEGQIDMFETLDADDEPAVYEVFNAFEDEAQADAVPSTDTDAAQETDAMEEPAQAQNSDVVNPFDDAAESAEEAQKANLMEEPAKTLEANMVNPFEDTAETDAAPNAEESVKTADTQEPYAPEHVDAAQIAANDAEPKNDDMMEETKIYKTAKTMETSEDSEVVNAFDDENDEPVQPAPVATPVPAPAPSAVLAPPQPSLKEIFSAFAPSILAAARTMFDLPLAERIAAEVFSAYAKLATPPSDAERAMWFASQTKLRCKELYISNLAAKEAEQAQHSENIAQAQPLDAESVEDIETTSVAAEPADNEEVFSVAKAASELANETSAPAQLLFEPMDGNQTIDTAPEAAGAHDNEANADWSEPVDNSTELFFEPMNGTELSVLEPEPAEEKDEMSTAALEKEPAAKVSAVSEAAKPAAKVAAPPLPYPLCSSLIASVQDERAGEVFATLERSAQDALIQNANTLIAVAYQATGSRDAACDAIHAVFTRYLLRYTPMDSAQRMAQLSFAVDTWCDAWCAGQSRGQ